MNAIGGRRRLSTTISGGVLGTARPRNDGAPGGGRRSPTRGTPPRRGSPLAGGARRPVLDRRSLWRPRERQGRPGEHRRRHTTPPIMHPTGGPTAAAGGTAARTACGTWRRSPWAAHTGGGAPKGWRPQGARWRTRRRFKGRRPWGGGGTLKGRRRSAGEAAVRVDA